MKVRHPSYITITIPAYKEENILQTLKSVLSCNRNGIHLSIHILVNESIDELAETTEINSLAFKDLQSYISTNNLHHIVQVDQLTFDNKHAGVGLARKTLMDAVAAEYTANNINGVIVALDADCTVQSNYLQEIRNFFHYTSYEAASLYFEHPLENTREYFPIIEYEFHLRYFIYMQKRLDLPFAIHTVGSSMACLSNTYLAKGGMNKRKAGEDFYFMHKFIKDGVCGILTETTVYPDGRVSDRVPFGTGRAIGKYEEEAYIAMTYNPAAFEALQSLFGQVSDLYHSTLYKENIDPIILEYLATIHFDTKLTSIRKNTSSQAAFIKRFYQFFDAFQLMKCLHYIRDTFPDCRIDYASEYLQKAIFHGESSNTYHMLMKLREIDATRLNIETK